MPRPLYTRYQLYRKLGEPQSRSGQRVEDKIIDPTETRTPTPLPVASRCAEYAIPAPGIASLYITNKQCDKFVKP
jgi:hypothetical protein